MFLWNWNEVNIVQCTSSEERTGVPDGTVLHTTNQPVQQVHATYVPGPCTAHDLPVSFVVLVHG